MASNAARDRTGLNYTILAVVVLFAGVVALAVLSGVADDLLKRTAGGMIDGFVDGFGRIGCLIGNIFTGGEC